MAAPTREEIRLAIVDAWARENVEGRLEDALLFDFGTAAQCRLWDTYVDDDGDDAARIYSGVLQDVVDRALQPILDEIAPRAREALALAFEDFATRHPNVKRASPVVSHER